MPWNLFFKTASPDLCNVDIVLGVVIDLVVGAIAENSVSSRSLELASLARAVIPAVLHGKGVHRKGGLTQRPDNEQSCHGQEDHGTKGSRRSGLIGKQQHYGIDGEGWFENGCLFEKL